MHYEKVALAAFVLALVISQSQTQFNNNNFRNNNFRPANNNFRPANNNNFRPANNNNFRPANNNNNFRPANNNNFRSNNNNNRNTVFTTTNNNNNNNFRATPSGSRDRSGTEIYPGCSATVCLPQANLCSVRRQKVGHFLYSGKSYWFSWSSDENDLRNARWNWFTGRNYCRKMCMDMVSFDNAAEEKFVTDVMRLSNIDNVHTAGRLCDKEVEGCNQTRFQPLSINGWFWASNLLQMPATNIRNNPRVHNNWAAGQPNGSIRPDGFGLEACVALKRQNGNYKWFDEACGTRRHLVCEDLPIPNINFVRQQNPNVNIP